MNKSERLQHGYINNIIKNYPCIEKKTEICTNTVLEILIRVVHFLNCKLIFQIFKIIDYTTEKHIPRRQKQETRTFYQNYIK